MVEYLRTHTTKVGGYEIATLSSGEIPERAALKKLLLAMHNRDKVAAAALVKRGAQLASAALVPVASADVSGDVAGAVNAPAGGLAGGVVPDAVAVRAIGDAASYHADGESAPGGREVAVAGASSRGGRGDNRGGRSARSRGVKRARNVGEHAGAVGDVGGVRGDELAVDVAVRDEVSGGGGGDAVGRRARHMQSHGATRRAGAEPLVRSATLPREAVTSRSGRQSTRVVVRK